MTTSYSVKFRQVYNLKDLHCFSKCSSFFDHVANVNKGTLNQVLMYTTCAIINTNKVLELKWGSNCQSAWLDVYNDDNAIYVLHTEPPIALVL